MAIAFDAASSGASAGGATSLTVSHTCTGSNLILFVAVNNFGGSGVTGVTYNGVSMTQIGNFVYNPGDTGSTDTIFLYCLVGPATGAHDIVASRSDTGSNFTLAGASYTGASQTGVPDASTTNGKTSGTTTTLTTTLSSTADNCWFVIAAGATNTITASTGVTSRANPVQTHIGDSNSAKTPAGSYSMDFTFASGTLAGTVMASFKPVATTSIKTVNDLAYASVKTKNGLAVTSVKTINGLA